MFKMADTYAACGRLSHRRQWFLQYNVTKINSPHKNIAKIYFSTRSHCMTSLWTHPKFNAIVYKMTIPCPNSFCNV